MNDKNIKKRRPVQAKLRLFSTPVTADRTTSASTSFAKSVRQPQTTTTEIQTPSKENGLKYHTPESMFSPALPKTGKSLR